MSFETVIINTALLSIVLGVKEVLVGVLGDWWCIVCSLFLLFFVFFLLVILAFKEV
jgi:hypothetical protein